MATLAATKENLAAIEALKKISQCKWVGNTVHPNLDFCLTAINLETGKNSGWYNATAVRIPSLTGIYMINQDGSFCYEFRVVKENESTFKIETLTMEGFNQFEQIYLGLLNV